MHANLRRNLILFLAGLLVAFIGWRVGPGSVPAPSSEVGRGRLVFPGLAAKLPAVTRIAIESAGKTIVLRPRPLQSQGGGQGGAGVGGWGLEERGLYPVRTDKLRAMLSGLTLLRQVSPRTADPRLYSRIGVEDPAAAGGASTGVSLFDAGGKLVAALIVGHQRVRAAGGLPDEIYIRRPGHRRSWLAQGALTVDADPQLWLQRGIVDIARDRIASVTVHRDATTLRFVARAGKLVLASPKTHPPLDAYKLDDLAGALQALTLEDVAPASTEPGKPVGSSVFRTSDGLAITVRAFRDGADLWAQFEASGKGAAPLAARLRGWTYRLGGWMERQLVPTLAELAPTPPAGAAPIPPASAGPAAAGPAAATAPAATTPKGPTSQGSAAPGSAAPGSAAPGSAAPGSAAPGSAAPGSAGPSGTVHGTATPGTTMPKTTAPGTTAPGTTAPGTTAPGTTAPGTTAPGTTAPATGTPRTVPPNGKAPNGKAIQGKAKIGSRSMEAAALPGAPSAGSPAPAEAAAAAAAVASYTGR